MTPKRLWDPNQFAKSIIDIADGAEAGSPSYARGTGQGTRLIRIIDGAQQASSVGRALLAGREIPCTIGYYLLVGSDCRRP